MSALPEPPPFPAVEVERNPINDLISVILRVGVYLSSAILLFGLLFFLIREPASSGIVSNVLRGSSTAPRVPDQLAQVARGVAALDGASLIQLGVLALLATPVVRVAASIVIFLFERDWLYTGLTAIVLALLLFSIFFLGALGHG